MWYRTIISVLVIVSMGTFGQSLLADTYRVACEGTVCGGGGGGGRQYEYSVKNNESFTENLRLFYVGTDDLNGSDYSNWLMPPGFTTLLGTSFVIDGTLLSTPNTDHKQTAHGQPHPLPVSADVPTAGKVVWFNNAGILLQPGQTATFGFDNPNTYQDVEWNAFTAPGVGTSADASMLIVGPAGVYGNGYAHGPVPEPATVVLLGIGVIAFLAYTWRRSRRS